MVVKIQNSYRSMSNTIDYNEDKVSEGAAERIAVLNFEAETASDIHERFEFFERRNIRTENVSFQMSINPNPDNGEKLSDEQVTYMAQKLMTDLGYEDQPIVIYRHNDIEREHFHVVSIRTNINGKKIKDFKERKDLQRCLRSLSKELGFTIGNEKSIKSEKSEHDENRMPAPPRRPVTFNADAANLAKRYSEIFDAALQYKFKSLTQLKAIMQWYGVSVTKLTENQKDILFLQGIDMSGKGNATPMKQTELNREMNAEAEAVIQSCKADSHRYLPERRRIESLFLSALKESTSLEDLKQRLAVNNIGLFVSREKDGKIFGLTMVDHNSRMAFKGSEISKDITIKVFRELEQNGWDTTVISLQQNQDNAERQAYGISDAASDAGSDNGMRSENEQKDMAEFVGEALSLIGDMLMPTGSGNSDAQRKQTSDARQGRKKKDKKPKY